MNLIRTPLQGLFVLEPRVFGDERGFFMESYNERTFRELVGFAPAFVQDNHSRSAAGVLRGMHYQVEPAGQGKLVRVVQGAVFDVAIDLRRSSPTFGRWHGVELSAQNKRQFWIPVGFAHGFYVLTESADFLYKTTGAYSPGHERCIAWDDPDVGIEWPLAGGEPLLSPKDRAGTPLARAEVFA